MPDRLAALADVFPKIRYRIDVDARANLAWQLERAKEARGIGAVETVVTDWSQRWHLPGTCRMGDDPAASVVDRSAGLTTS